MSSVPTVLLIGAGKFGKNYIRILKELAAQGQIKFRGVCVTTDSSAENINAEFHLPTYTDYQKELVGVDVVFVVTPPETHAAIVKNCLPFVHVFVEKPLAFTNEEILELDTLAAASGHQLMTGYIFRFHPVTTLLIEKLAEMRIRTSDLRRIEGVFVNAADTDVGRSVPYELIHWYDLVTFLFGAADVTSVFTRTLGNDRLIYSDVRYQWLTDVSFTLGWWGAEKERTLKIFLKNGAHIVANFVTHTISIVHAGHVEDTVAVPSDALLEEVAYFLRCIATGAQNSVPPREVLTSTRLAESVTAQLSPPVKPSASARPKVAVIGAGIFGCNVALELAEFADVTVFEKNSDLMQEASYINQFRHHLGYHYPRSSETVIDIQASAPLFEERYNEAVVRNIPSYYGISASDSRVTPEAFLSFCDNHALPYKIARPPAGYINEELMALMVEVPEPIYHYPRIKRVTEALLTSLSERIKVRINTLVTDCELLVDGTKRILTRDSAGGEEELAFDYVVNATYAHINAFAGWIKMSPHPVRIDVAEVLVVSLPVPLVAITVMDGPFGGILPSGNPGQCTVYHAKASIVDRYSPADGLVVPVTAPKSHSHYIYQECLKLFPILTQATLIESRITHRGVLAFHEHDDARVADVISHGFGCWSVLSGKIQGSVKTARGLAQIIKKASIGT